MLNRYHHYLSHPGTTHLAKTVRQSCNCSGLLTDCVQLVSKCAICKKIRKNKPKYVKLSVKAAEATPWVEIHVDLIGHYPVYTKTICKGYSSNADFNSHDVY